MSVQFKCNLRGLNAVLDHVGIVWCWNYLLPIFITFIDYSFFDQKYHCIFQFFIILIRNRIVPIFKVLLINNSIRGRVRRTKRSDGLVSKNLWLRLTWTVSWFAKIVDRKAKPVVCRNWVVSKSQALSLMKCLILGFTDLYASLRSAERCTNFWFTYSEAINSSIFESGIASNSCTTSVRFLSPFKIFSIKILSWNRF